MMSSWTIPDIEEENVIREKEKNATRDEQENTTQNEEDIISGGGNDDGEFEEKGTVRRSQREERRPKYLNDYVNTCVLNAEVFLEDLSEIYADIRGRQGSNKVISSCSRSFQEEMKTFVENNIWTLTKLPPERKALDNKWVFKIKFNENGDI